MVYKKPGFRLIRSYFESSNKKAKSWYNNHIDRIAINRNEATIGSY